MRRASAADAAVIGEIQVASWRSEYQRILPAQSLSSLSPEPLALTLRAQIERPPSPDHRAWVIELGGRIAGFCATGPCRDEAADVIATTEVHAILVDPERAGRGLGRTLLTWCIDDLRERGYLEVVLWVPEKSRRGRSVCEAAGFQLSGRSEDRDVAGAPLPHLPYRRSLRKLSPRAPTSA